MGHDQRVLVLAGNDVGGTKKEAALLSNLVRWAHITELGLRLGLPGDLFAGKADIAEPRSSEEWEAMRHRVSTDCVLTSMIALPYWRANGLIKLDQSAVLLTIADWCLRNRCIADAHVAPLTRVRAEMFARLAAQMLE